MGYLQEFTQDDIFINTLKTHPEDFITFYSSSAYINDERYMGRNIASGSINLYELNVDREDNNLIYPFIVKDGLFWSFDSITTEQYNSASYGEILTGSYPLEASVYRSYISSSTLPTEDSSDEVRRSYFIGRKRLISLRNTLDYYKFLSDRYNYDTFYATGNINMIEIPSIYYDSGIEKGTVELNFYFTGSLLANATDHRKNGELISTIGPTSGSVIGTVLYNEGFVLLNNEAELHASNEDAYTGTALLDKPKWTYFGAYSDDSIPGTVTMFPSSSLYTMKFNGTSEVPVMTMMATAEAGNLNNSQNPTWVSSSNGAWRNNRVFYTSGTFAEPEQLTIKNTIQSQYCDFEDEFEKQVFISEIGIYDDDKNLIGIAKLANPVQKKETDQYTFKLKLDL